MAYYWNSSYLLSLLLITSLAVSGNKVLAARSLLDTTFPKVPELPKPELPSLPKPELPPMPKFEVPPMPHVPALPKPELPPLPKLELPPVPHVPTLPKPELPPVPHVPHVPARTATFAQARGAKTARIALCLISLICPSPHCPPSLPFQRTFPSLPSPRLTRSIVLEFFSHSFKSSNTYGL
ncbi:hypothetical protein ACSBR1_029998 [Camellia fascicularis]